MKEKITSEVNDLFDQEPIQIFISLIKSCLTSDRWHHSNHSHLYIISPGIHQRGRPSVDGSVEGERTGAGGGESEEEVLSRPARPGRPAINPGVARD